METDGKVLSCSAQCNFLHLPPPLRHLLLSQKPLSVGFRRCLKTESRSGVNENNPPPPPFVNSKTASPALLTLSSTTLNSYATSVPPDPPQLKYSAAFFRASPPRLLFSAAHFRSFPPSSFPEVAFLGRSNVGKSSLLNALFGRTNIKDAHVSKRPGRTRTMNGFGVTGGQVGGDPPSSGEKEAAWEAIAAWRVGGGGYAWIWRR